MNLAKSFGIDPNKLRTRTFEYNGQKFTVRVPLAHEAEEMFKKSENPSDELINEKYQELTKDLQSKKDDIKEISDDIVFKDDDILIGDKSMREMAKNQAGTEIRIVEAFKLLVPIDGTDFGQLTYKEINDEIPLPIQLNLVKKIVEVISPSYEETRKN
mgnify:CR=1 FL=1